MLQEPKDPATLKRRDSKSINGNTSSTNEEVISPTALFSDSVVLKLWAVASRALTLVIHMAHLL
jgi:hypothetical protein